MADKRSLPLPLPAVRAVFAPYSLEDLRTAFLAVHERARLAGAHPLAFATHDWLLRGAKLAADVAKWAGGDARGAQILGACRVELDSVEPDGVALRGGTPPRAMSLLDLAMWNVAPRLARLAGAAKDILPDLERAAWAGNALGLGPPPRPEEDPGGASARRLGPMLACAALLIKSKGGSWPDTWGVMREWFGEDCPQHHSHVRHMVTGANAFAFEEDDFLPRLAEAYQKKAVLAVRGTDHGPTAHRPRVVEILVQSFVDHQVAAKVPEVAKAFPLPSAQR